MFSQAAIDYACRDADATLQLYHRFKPELEREGLWECYKTTMATMPLLLAMQETGWRIDVPHLEHERHRLDIERLAVEMDIADLGFEGLNALSPLQVGEALFEKLGLVPQAYTKGTHRPSTEDKHLQAMASAHPLVDKICEVRELVKLKGYVTDILANTHGVKLRPRLNPCGTPTGRLACRDPNLLAIPKRSARGHRIRRGFLPPSGFELWSWDLSQIELRVLAIESEDPALVRAFLKGEDLHAATAKRMFTVDAVTKDQRFAAKAVNFGIPMGISERGLVQQLHKEGQLHITEADTTEWLRAWNQEAYPAASARLEAVVSQCRDRGYVTALGGRRRYLPGVRARSQSVRNRAIRQCQSFPMQAGAQHIMHGWEARVYDEVVRPGIASAILQIHDDLVMAGPKERWEEVHEMMTSLLPQDYCVPIVSSSDRGETWGDFG